MRNPEKPEQVKAWLRRLAGELESVQDLLITHGQQGAIRGTLAEVWPDDRVRHLCLGWLLGEPGKPLSTKELSIAQWVTLKRWIGHFRPDEQSPWQHDPVMDQEAEWIIWEVRKMEREGGKKAGQLEIPADMPLLDAALELGGKVTETGPEQTSPYYKAPAVEIKARKPRPVPYTFD